MLSIINTLFCITFIATLAGMIRPSLVVRWGEKRTRRRVLLYYGIATIVLMFFGVEIHSKQKAPEYLEGGTRLLSVARKAYDSQDYSTAINSANEAIQILDRVKEDLPEAAVLTHQAQALLDSAKKAEVQAETRVHLERGTELILVARKAYDSQDYSTVINSANEATQILDRVKEDLPEAAVLTHQTQALLDSAKKAEARVHLERGTRLLSIARKAYNSQDYSTAISSANEATQILNRIKGDLPEAAVLADQTQALLDSAKKARARGLERGTRLISIARRAYDSQDYSTAVDSAEKATQILNRIKGDLPEAAVLADQAQAFLKSAKETLLEELAIPQVSVHQLFREYDRNEVAADIKYKGKIVVITGTIQDIRTTFITDDPYIILVGHRAGDITCYFSEGEKPSVAKVSKGQRVKIKGEVSGLSMGSIIVRDCKLQ